MKIVVALIAILNFVKMSYLQNPLRHEMEFVTAIYIDSLFHSKHMAFQRKLKTAAAALLNCIINKPSN